MDSEIADSTLCMVGACQPIQLSISWDRSGYTPHKHILADNIKFEVYTHIFWLQQDNGSLFKNRKLLSIINLDGLSPCSVRE